MRGPDVAWKTPAALAVAPLGLFCGGVGGVSTSVGGCRYAAPFRVPHLWECVDAAPRVGDEGDDWEVCRGTGH